MNMQFQSQVKSASAPPPSFTPLRTGLLQRKCACGGPAGLSGECEECGKKRLTGIQTKLSISEPGDKYEQEADQVAERLLRMPVPHDGQKKDTPSAGPLVQRRVSESAGGLTEAPPIVNDVLRSSGQPLDAATQAFMESRFGHDFSRVRVHTDACGAESARAVHALAYTVGREVVFGAGQYEPRTSRGRQLLAHELTHTVQQSGAGEYIPARSSAWPVSEPDDVYEREAASVAKRVATGAPTIPNDPLTEERRLQRLTIQRQEEEAVESSPAEANFTEPEVAEGNLAEPEVGEGGEALEQRRGGCTGSRRLDFSLRNFRDVNFTMPQPCTRVRVQLRALWDPDDACSSPIDTTYPISLGGTAHRMPAGVRGIEEACPGTPPQTRTVIFRVQPGSHRLRISTGGVTDFTLITQGFLQIRR
jgi:hypothetical protein